MSSPIANPTPTTTTNNDKGTHWKKILIGTGIAVPVVGLLLIAMASINGDGPSSANSQPWQLEDAMQKEGGQVCFEAAKIQFPRPETAQLVLTRPANDDIGEGVYKMMIMGEAMHELPDGAVISTDFTCQNVTVRGTNLDNLTAAVKDVSLHWSNDGEQVMKRARLANGKWELTDDISYIDDTEKQNG
ncbi:hypothetical protein ACUY3K_08950 [Corynebacterium uberis]|uniref:hypothetical protein n=1 Tax=Corynebacterium TaxID=1716 RepID=UPI001D0B27FF|nr:MULTISPECIES: hypothetical protein [Corynebacterium]MCZ9308750.1 hypothetical protein [Corynebacterium sp. c6VSa_13]UDL72719.1 hypothetical protein LH391_06195 [Corynebacterium uberis]UDL76405.1 hypothetical protein LH393_03210 [Corynebacterium uberis]UDL78617.1 hypothetical protein LH394_03195 [Corynebacterium uberis]UDL80896.1 hypothetical protein LH392_03620 [Corynebacterium uberis]